jgi:hypothetical protein
MDQGVIGEGQNMLVYKGHYTEGRRDGGDCVCKKFKTGVVFAASYFVHELAVFNKAREIVNAFNAANLIDRKILLNQPEVWENFTEKSSHHGEKVLVEPMIENFQKFNSNSGWADDDPTPWNEVMQALSHFSYHQTSGSHVICDLQGGVYKDGAVLTDPVILSRDQWFGPTDLRQEGITTFFAHHTCNQYCSRTWSKPGGKSIHFKAIKGTTMIQPAQVPARKTRAPLTKT